MDLLSKLDSDFIEDGLYIQRLLKEIDSFRSTEIKYYGFMWGVNPECDYLTHINGTAGTRSKQEVESFYSILSHLSNTPFTLSELSIKQIHRDLFKHEMNNHHCGNYKVKSNTIKLTTKNNGELYYRPLSDANNVADEMANLIVWFNKAIVRKERHPLLIIHLFIYEMLSIHPFENGNGRLSRILYLLLMINEGYHFIQYGSLVRAIDYDRPNYIKTLYCSQILRGTENEKIDLSTIYFLQRIKMMIQEITYNNSHQLNFISNVNR